MTTSKDDFSKFRAYEFGGPWGAAFIIAFSHLAVYYLWIAVTYYRGAVIYPHGFDDILPFVARMWAHIRDGARPTLSAAAFYIGFVGLQAVFAVTMPGVRARGLPIPSLGGESLEYRCNGVASWYATLALAAVLHWTGLLRLSFLVDNLGPLAHGGGHRGQRTRRVVVHRSETARASSTARRGTSSTTSSWGFI